jgi:hypothetical protein
MVYIWISWLFQIIRTDSRYIDILSWPMKTCTQWGRRRCHKRWQHWTGKNNTKHITIDHLLTRDGYEPSVLDHQNPLGNAKLSSTWDLLNQIFIFIRSPGGLHAGATGEMQVHRIKKHSNRQGSRWSTAGGDLSKSEFYCPLRVPWKFYQSFLRISVLKYKLRLWLSRLS